MSNDWPMDQAQAKVDWSREDERRRMLAQQNAAVGQLAGIGALGAVPQAPPRTLASAMGGLDILEKRLAETADKALRLATLIGGPVPVQGGDANKPAPERPHAMQVLNDRIQFIGIKVDAINAALDAMSRSLGALDG